MFNLLANKTAEERKAISQKAVATRRANIQAKKESRHAATQRIDKLSKQVSDLEQRIAALRRMETMHLVSAALTGKALLFEQEIAESAKPWSNASGVYFLLDGNEVVYVGQSVNVYSRISQHKDKLFDRYAYVPCRVESLDALESLYIHFLRPRLNYSQQNGSHVAPLTLDELIAGMNRNTNRNNGGR